VVAPGRGLLLDGLGVGAGEIPPLALSVLFPVEVGAVAVTATGCPTPSLPSSTHRNAKALLPTHESV